MSASGFVVWFTGLSGAGKSTLAARLAAELSRRGVHVETLDGDEVRTHLSKGLSFSREDRDTNVRRIGFVAKLLARSGACAITAAISPYADVRDAQRRAIPRFVEVYCECPVDVLAARDPKGLYQRALAGEIQHFTGVNDPYEPPTDPEVHCRTDRESTDESLAKILSKLDALGYITAAQDARAHHGRPRPLGGELVDQVWHGPTLPPAEKSVALDVSEVASLKLLTRGVLSPLKGFMTEKDRLRVVSASRLENGRPWALPVTLAVAPERAESLSVGDTLSLTHPEGVRVGTLELSDRYRVEGDARVFLGGEVHAHAGEGELDPRALRGAFDWHGFARVAAVPIDRVADPALRYVLRRALEDADAVLALVVHDPAEVYAPRLDAARAACAAMPEGRVFVRALPLRAPSPDAWSLSLAILAQNLGADRVWFEHHRDLSSLDALAPGELAVEITRVPPLGTSARAGGVTALHAAEDAVPCGPSRAS